jgi:2-iminobutanoate/2-iminopropanoate deaminase
MKHFPEFDEVYGKYFSKPLPARMTIASTGIYDNLDVEIDAVVYLPNI